MLALQRLATSGLTLEDVVQTMHGAGFHDHEIAESWGIGETQVQHTLQWLALTGNDHCPVDVRSAVAFTAAWNAEYPEEEAAALAGIPSTQGQYLAALLRARGYRLARRPRGFQPKQPQIATAPLAEALTTASTIWQDEYRVTAHDIAVLLREHPGHQHVLSGFIVKQMLGIEPQPSGRHRKQIPLSSALIIGSALGIPPAQIEEHELPAPRRVSHWPAAIARIHHQGWITP